MPTEKFQNRYRIPSARAIGHDYSGGAYFVTICTAGMEHYFGEIVDGEMIFSEMGTAADECVRKMGTLHNDIVVPLYQIMPNHIHLIVIVETMDVVETPIVVETPYYDVSTTGTTDIPKNEKMQSIANQCGRLSHIISRFKSAITKHARQNNIPFAWQSRFHDRIIRDQNEMNRIADYIENNVAKWDLDRCNNDINNGRDVSLYVSTKNTNIRQ